MASIGENIALLELSTFSPWLTSRVREGKQANLGSQAKEITNEGKLPI